ncbi:MAG: hypothetical protein JSV88_27580, partial [Candidatus Aminicenantes bacterium]
FSGISKDIWEYQICGYRVMKKWLKDRRKRALSCPDIIHYIRMARALQLTLRYQHEIDRLCKGIENNLLTKNPGEHK